MPLLGFPRGTLPGHGLARDKPQCAGPTYSVLPHFHPQGSAQSLAQTWCWDNAHDRTDEATDGERLLSSCSAEMEWTPDNPTVPSGDRRGGPRDTCAGISRGSDFESLTFLTVTHAEGLPNGACFHVRCIAQLRRTQSQDLG